MNLVGSFLRGVGLRGQDRRWRITGPYKGITGYDRMVRSIIPLLQQRGVKIELQELRDWSPTRRQESLPRSLTRRQRFPAADLHLHFGIPPQVIPSPECPNINYSMFESNRIPESWAEASKRVDLIIVPTESSRQSWCRGGVPEEKVVVCPQGADFDLFSPGACPLQLRTMDGRLVSQFRHRFLNVAEFITRKNLPGLLRVWLRTTTAKDDAVLILKLGFYVLGSRKVFAEKLKQIEEQEHKTFAQAAPIVLCDRQLTESEMPRLYRAATHYWTMSLGEGFDLPMVEAAACDLQLVAPSHSSYLHYLSSQNAFLIPVQEIEATILEDPGLAAYFDGSMWWRPDENSAGQIVRNILDGVAAPLDSIRRSLQPTSTWNAMATVLMQILQGRFESPRSSRERMMV